MDSMDDEGVNAEADLEVDKIITEITSGVLSGAGSVPNSRLQQQQKEQVQTTAEETTAEDQGPTPEELLQRLQAL